MPTYLIGKATSVAAVHAARALLAVRTDRRARSPSGLHVHDVVDSQDAVHTQAAKMRKENRDAHGATVDEHERTQAPAVDGGPATDADQFGIMLFEPIGQRFTVEDIGIASVSPPIRGLCGASPEFRNMALDRLDGRTRSKCQQRWTTPSHTSVTESS